MASSRVGVRIRARTGWRAGDAEVLAWGESGGFTRAGLRASHEIPPREHERDGLLLDGGGLFVAHFRNCRSERRRQAKLFKCRRDKAAPAVVKLESIEL